MISVSVPKEISDYKEKVIFGLSLRQLVCGVIAVGLAVATGLLLVQVLGLSIDIAGYIIMVEVVPLMALGFVRPRGRPFEEFARLYLDSKLGRHKFSYQTESLIDLTLIPERSSHGDFNISKGQRGRATGPLWEAHKGRRSPLPLPENSIEAEKKTPKRTTPN